MFKTSAVLLGIIFLAGCGKQQVSQTQPTVTKQPDVKKQCQNFPPPSFCPGGVGDIIVTGNDSDGCSIYGCKSKSVQDGCVDSDGGKNIYIKGGAISKEKGRTLHVSADSCATKNSSEDLYLEGLPSCSGDGCYVMEGLCQANGNPPNVFIIDGKEAIKCPNGCNDGACKSTASKQTDEVITEVKHLL